MARRRLAEYMLLGGKQTQWVNLFNEFDIWGLFIYHASMLNTLFPKFFFLCSDYHITFHVLQVIRVLTEQWLELSCNPSHRVP